MFAFAEAEGAEPRHVVKPSWIEARPKAPVAEAPIPSPPPAPADASLVVELPAEAAPPEPAIDPTKPLRARIEELEAALATTRAALDASLESAASFRARTLERAETDLVGLAVAIARRVVAREIAMDPTLVTRWAREAIESISEPDLVIAVGSELARLVEPSAWAEELGPGVRVEPDAELPPHGIELRTANARVRTCSRARLEAVAECLGLGQDEPEGAR